MAFLWEVYLRVSSWPSQVTLYQELQEEPIWSWKSLVRYKKINKKKFQSLPIPKILKNIVDISSSSKTVNPEAETSFFSWSFHIICHHLRKWRRLWTVTSQSIPASKKNSSKNRNYYQLSDTIWTFRLLIHCKESLKTFKATCVEIFGPQKQG